MFVNRIGQVEPKPSVRPLGETPTKSIAVIISPQIQNEIVINVQPFNRTELSAYRQSLRTGLKNALASSFIEVSFVQAPPAEGLLLEIHRFEPMAVHVGTQTAGTTGGYTTTTTDSTGYTMTTTTPVRPIHVYVMQFEINFDAMLFENGEQVFAIRDRLGGEFVSWKKAELPRVLRSAMEAVLSKIIEGIQEQLVSSEEKPQPEEAAQPLESSETTEPDGE